MEITLDGYTVTSGSTFTWPDDNPGGNTAYMGLRSCEKHLISVSGGTGTITADQGSGYQSVAALSDDYDTYLIPFAEGIKIAASGGDITLSIKSYSDKGDGC